MKFYKENGVNPLGGCLPMVAQFPVFISLFQVLRAIADWTPGTTPKFGLTTSVVQSALHAKVFGVLLSDKFLFMHPPATWPVRLVILATVAASACTTFLTMRQSSKRGMMNATPDPDNPMAQSQKYMMYIAPFFALTGLYWQYGLVIYWVTNNLWTMGQQHFMYRNMPVVGSAPAEGATAAANGRTQATRTSGTAAKTGSTAKPGTSKTSSAAKSGGSGAKTGTTAGTSAGKDGTQSSARTSARNLLRPGKKAEPEPEPAPEPTTKIVRQQPVRQSRSKRSGRR